MNFFKRLFVQSNTYYPLFLTPEIKKALDVLRRADVKKRRASLRLVKK